MKKFVMPSIMEGNRSLYILDASVVLKWFLEEAEFRDQAILLKNHHVQRKITIGMPFYGYSEILNTLGSKAPKQQALAALSFIYNLRFAEFEISYAIANLAIDLMKKYQSVSFYDAGYHALACDQNATFVTADKKYFQKTKQKGNIVFLGDYL